MSDIENSLVCHTCHRENLEYIPQNYRINISMPEWEQPFSEHITNEHIGLVFLSHSYQVWKSIKRIISEHILFPQSRRIIFSSQLVSIFLSNALYLLQSMPLLEIIFAKVVRYVFLLDNKILLVVQRYDLWDGATYIGGIFPRQFLLNRHVFLSIYNNIKYSMEMQNFSFIQRVLDRHYRDIGHEMMVQIKHKVNAHLFSLHNPIPDLNIPPQHGFS